MADDTQTQGAPAIPESYAWCSWHKEFSPSTRLVRIDEQGSASGGGQFACAPCREKHGLVPVADQP